MTNGHNNWDPQCARWRQAQNSIGPIANFAFQHKVSSIDIGFMHHQRNKPYKGIQVLFRYLPSLHIGKPFSP